MSNSGFWVMALYIEPLCSIWNRPHIQRLERNFSIKENFEVKIFTTDKYNSNNPSLLARLRNQLSMAINKYCLLPKIILIVLDRDVINLVKVDNFGMSLIFGSLIDWIAREFDRMVQAQKDRLPNRAVLIDHPKFIWMAPPLNINFFDNKQRDKFSKALANVVNFHPDMTTMHLVKGLNYGDSSIFVKEAKRFSNEGLAKYWSSIDSAVEHWIIHLWAKRGTLKTGPSQAHGGHRFVKRLKREFNSKYHWDKIAKATPPSRGRPLPKP